MAVVAAQTQMSGPVLEQLAAGHLLDVADDVLTARRVDLRRQRDALVAALAHHLPDWEVPVPAGGLVVWCRLPSGTSSSALVSTAEARGLLLAAGPRFGTGHAFDDRLRLPYTQPVDVIERGVALLAQAVADQPVPARSGTDDSERRVVV
jgi:DNA-binding transcriptional MocR family regulator